MTWIRAFDAKKPRDPLPTTSLAYSVYIIVLLSLVGLLGAVDRNILALLLVPIKRDLHASDAAMGALTGTAFALVYATSALPMAHLADRTSRRNIVVLALAFWSGMTALCGFAGSYFQMLLARIGVAAGESANSPATLSIVADLFPAHRRGTAISVLTVGTAAGYSFGSYADGVLNDLFGWHVAMMAVGAPGLVLALLIWLTVPEPARGAQDRGKSEPILRSLGRILTIPTVPPLLLGMTFLAVANAIWLSWLPAFLMRVHHLSATEMGVVVGMLGVGAVLANVITGVASDRAARGGPRWRMYFACLMILASVPLLVGSLLLPATIPAVICMNIYTLAAGGLTTVTSAALLSIARPDIRAFTVALFGMVVTIVGSGAGPWMVGALNDALRSAYGIQAVRYTMLLVPATLATAGLMFFWASWTIDKDAKTSTAV